MQRELAVCIAFHGRNYFVILLRENAYARLRDCTRRVRDYPFQFPNDQRTIINLIVIFISRYARQISLLLCEQRLGQERRRENQ